MITLSTAARSAGAAPPVVSCERCAPGCAAWWGWRADRVPAAAIEAGRTARGGWSRTVLAGWGVPWPPPRGWKRVLTGAFDGPGALRGRGDAPPCDRTPRQLALG